jgi:hypothetical protein
LPEAEEKLLQRLQNTWQSSDFNHVVFMLDNMPPPSTVLDDGLLLQEVLGCPQT